MSITSVIRTQIRTTDFYDIATTATEQEVDRCLYTLTLLVPDKLLKYIDYYPNCKGVLVINKDTGKQQPFDNPADFDSWKKSISLSELVNCIIEIHFADSKGQGTDQYYFEPTDMDMSSNKRIKLYNFEVLEKDSERIIPEVSFEETNCSRGLDKIQKSIRHGEFGLSPYNCIVLLNGIDITEYFSDPIAVDLRTLKKEERGSSHFRYIHLGLNERIHNLKQNRGFMASILADDPTRKEKALAEIDKQIQDLQDQLKAIGK